MAKSKKQTKKKVVFNKKPNRLVAVLFVVLVVIVSYVVFTMVKGMNDSLADNKYTVYKAQGYDVRACRTTNKPSVTYNAITGYVLATNGRANSQFFKFIVKFTNTVDPSKTFSEGNGLATVKDYKNPYGVNSNMTANVLLNGGGSIVSAPIAVHTIKLCP